jgi:serine/threonine-protein kinase
LTDVRPALPPRLARIIVRCLEKDPRERFQSALDLRNELADLRQESSDQRSAVSGVVAAAKPRRKFRWVFAAGVLVVVAALIVVLSLTLGPETEAPAPPDAAAVSEQKMIIIFPFENLGSPEDDYFAAGITDEISSRLAGIGSLGVISRSSATQYDRTGKTMAQIREDFGVDYVLEGTVRWAGASEGSSRVRVTPHLLDVSRDAQIWSDSYDEVLDEIFAVQSDIAAKVVQELDLTLNESERQTLRARPTENLEAYQVYLRGIDNASRDYYSEDNRRRTIRLFERAVDLDPDFALAWTWLSAEHSYIYHLRYDMTDERRDAAKQAVDRALALQPDLPDAHLALGIYYYRCFRDYDRALAEVSIAREGLPNDYRVLETIGAIQRRQGLWEEALVTANQAIRLNPHESTGLWDTGVTYMNLGRYEEAERYYDRAIAIAPDETAAYGLKAWNRMVMGDFAGARATIDAAPADVNAFLAWIAFSLDLCEGNYDEALHRARSFPVEVFEGTVALTPKSSFEATVYELLGDEAAARERWEKSRRMLEEEIRERPDDARAHSALGIALAGLGLREDAIREGKRGVELYPVALDHFHGPQHVADLAVIYTKVGDFDAAFELLEQLVEMPAGVLPGELELAPVWAPLRDDPRYRALIHREQ